MLVVDEIDQEAADPVAIVVIEAQRVGDGTGNARGKSVSSLFGIDAVLRQEPRTRSCSSTASWWSDLRKNP